VDQAALAFLLPLVALAMFVLGVVVCCVAYFPLMKRPPSTVFISTLLIASFWRMLCRDDGARGEGRPVTASGTEPALGPIVLSPQAIATVLVARC